MGITSDFIHVDRSWAELTPAIEHAVRSLNHVINARFEIGLCKVEMTEGQATIAIPASPLVYQQEILVVLDGGLIEVTIRDTSGRWSVFARRARRKRLRVFVKAISDSLEGTVTPLEPFEFSKSIAIRGSFGAGIPVLLVCGFFTATGVMLVGKGGDGWSLIGIFGPGMLAGGWLVLQAIRYRLGRRSDAGAKDDGA